MKTHNSRWQTTALLAHVNAHDPRTLSDREIAATFDWWAAEAPKTMRAVFVMGSVQIFEDVIRAASPRNPAPPRVAAPATRHSLPCRFCRAIADG